MGKVFMAHSIFGVIQIEVYGGKLAIVSTAYGEWTRV